MGIFSPFSGGSYLSPRPIPSSESGLFMYFKRGSHLMSLEWSFDGYGLVWSGRVGSWGSLYNADIIRFLRWWLMRQKYPLRDKMHEHESGG